MQTHNSCNEDVQFPGFDLLDGARVYINQFGELLLGDAARHTLPAHVRAENAKFRKFGPTFGHALLGR